MMEGVAGVVVSVVAEEVMIDEGEAVAVDLVSIIMVT